MERFAHRPHYVCSSLNPDICTLLVGGSPYTYANFTSGPPLGCDAESCPPGDWSVIFGAFINATDTLNGPRYMNIVGCALSYGTVTIRQVGEVAPLILESSFEMNQDSEFISSVRPLRRIYTSDYGNSPYTFSASSGTGDGADSLYNSPVATLLLRAKANSTAIAVADRIADILELATVLAFSRTPHASDLKITTSVSTPQYAYDRHVLAVLLVPFIATILGTWGRWKVEGQEKIAGYDPVGIARRGPVKGLHNYGSRDDIDKKIVLGYRETTSAPTGTQVDTDRFAIQDVEI
ncbi:hypothetical protein EDB81DRAFT_869889 [Dactylonectria macrodidyma]|uniref:Uncharacterized protein n=1 Tax=Dactylonectria macrodidyma TaxID=307937 RepID=A0A9P9ER59_9HYPO|nr:hypothetical protein EDB81DRAFT_869889 [Dactylonectria macrodidyma]